MGRPNLSARSMTRIALRKPSGCGTAEVAPDVLLGVGALAVPENRHPTTVEGAQTGEHRLVVAEVAVAVELDDVGEERLDVVLGLGSLGVARDLDAVPRREVLVGVVAQPLDLLGELLDLGGEFGVVGEVETAKLVDLGLEVDERDARTP